MIVLVLIVLVVVVLLMGRRGRTGAPAPSQVPRPLTEALDRAVAAGTITAEQAGAIVEAERAAQPVTPGPGAVSRVPAIVEAAAYVGGILAIVGGVLLVAQFWDDLPTWSRITVLVVTAAALFTGGAFVPEETDPVFWRLRGVLWLLSAGALTGAAAVVAVDVADLGSEATALTIGTTVAVYDAVLWARRDRPLQHLTTLVGVLVAAGAALANVSGPGGVGLLVCAIGAAWTWLGLRRLLPPDVVAVAAGPVAALVGAAVTAGEWEDAAPVIGLALAIGLVASGIAVRERILAAVGLCGIFVFLPWGAAQLFGETLGVPVVMLLAGFLLLAITLAVLRRQIGPGGGPTSTGGQGMVHPAG